MAEKEVVFRCKFLANGEFCNVGNFLIPPVPSGASDTINESRRVCTQGTRKSAAQIVCDHARIQKITTEEVT